MPNTATSTLDNVQAGTHAGAFAIVQHTHKNTDHVSIYNDHGFTEVPQRTAARRTTAQLGC